MFQNRSKMVSLNLLAGGLTMCFAVTLCRCEMSEENYNKLLTKLKSPKGLQGSAFSTEHGKEHVRGNSSPHSSTKDHASYKKENPSVQTSAKTEENDAIQNTSGKSMVSGGFRVMRHVYEECEKKLRERFSRKFGGLGMKNDLLKVREKVISLYSCMKVFIFRQLDDFLSDDVISVSRYLEFVRDVRNGTNPRASHTWIGPLYALNILRKNWIDLAVARLEKFLQDHSLKFRLGGEVTQGRGRRRDHRMFAMMMMGFVIMASILVPMGFQFLTVLGGKSLLMAKMALIMSAINGLKKIATSNVGYGLYHAGPEAFHHDPHHHGYHDKIFHIKAQDQPESPFNVVI